jgi:hypothetical protein
MSFAWQENRHCASDVPLENYHIRLHGPLYTRTRKHHCMIRSLDTIMTILTQTGTSYRMRVSYMTDATCLRLTRVMDTFLVTHVCPAPCASHAATLSAAPDSCSSYGKAVRPWNSGKDDRDRDRDCDRDHDHDHDRDRDCVSYGIKPSCVLRIRRYCME